MTDTTTTKEEKLQDPTMEWKLLNKLLLTENRDYINRLPPALFTGIRIEVHRAMQLTFTKYGTITFEGVHEFMDGRVPGELTAANSGDLRTLLTQTTRLSKKRQLKQRAELLLKLSQDYDPDDTQIRDVLDFDPVMAEEDGTLALGAQKFMGNLHAKRSGDYIFAKTGFKSLDRNMGGEWKPQGLIILAGGVGSGKTTLWLNSAKHMAKGYVVKTGELIQTPSLFLSLEMSKEDLLVKLVGDELSIDTNDILSGDFDRMMIDHRDIWDTEEDIIAAIENKMMDLQQLPMYVIENGRLTLGQMIYEIRKHVFKYGVRVVCIDYMQIVNYQPTGNKNADLGTFALAMKEVAKRENITIIILSQINRTGEKVDIIRDSGEVQAVADVIMQLDREDEDDDGSVNTSSKYGVGIKIHKNRYGPTGKTLPMLMNGPYQRFIE